MAPPATATPLDIALLRNARVYRALCPYAPQQQQQEQQEQPLSPHRARVLVELFLSTT